MDRHTARKIADLLTWTRMVSVVPITVLAWYDLRWWVFGFLIVGIASKLELTWPFWNRSGSHTSDQGGWE